MILSERELEDVIFFQRFQSVEDMGLDIYQHDKVVRQLPLGSFGIPDLLGFSFSEEDGKLKEIHITIYELKSRHVSFEAISQVLKYEYAIGLIFINNPRYKDVDFFVSTCLIGNSIDNSVDFMAASAELRIRLFTYESTLSGVIFNRIYNYQYKPDSYEQTWLGEGRKLNLFKLFNGEQDVLFDPDKNESWVSSKQ